MAYKVSDRTRKSLNESIDAIKFYSINHIQEMTIKAQITYETMRKL